MYHSKIPRFCLDIKEKTPIALGHLLHDANCTPKTEDIITDEFSSACSPMSNSQRSSCDGSPQQPPLPADQPSKNKRKKTSAACREGASGEKKSMSRGCWSKEEDNILIDMVNKVGPEKWVAIGKELGSRTGKQCRERWYNHLDPNINKEPFTQEENDKILELFTSMGPRWAMMSKEMPGRPDNSIKNHFNTFIRPRFNSKDPKQGVPTTQELASPEEKPTKKKKKTDVSKNKSPPALLQPVILGKPFLRTPAIGSEILSRCLFDHFSPDTIQMPDSSNHTASLLYSASNIGEDPDLDFLINLGRQLGVSLDQN